jgi:UDP-glucose 4-epimerase
MKVLITGGAGYIGTELISALIAKPEVEKVIVYDNLSRPNYNVFLGLRLQNHTKVSFVKGELLDSRGLRKVLKEIDVVYHLAAKVTTPLANTDAHVYEQVNHWGTAELVYAVEESTTVKRFIYTSSTGVYGPSTGQAVTETTATAAQSLYAISKLRGEEHVRRLASRMETYIMRCGNVYGYSKSMRFDSVINKFAFEANFDNRVTVQGDGKQSRTFIHIDKVAHALANLTSTSFASGTYNLVDRTLRVFDIVDILKELVPPLEFIFINQHLRLHELNIQVNAEVNTALGINEERPLKAELEEFLAKFSF